MHLYAQPLTVTPPFYPTPHNSAKFKDRKKSKEIQNKKELREQVNVPSATWKIEKTALNDILQPRDRAEVQEPTGRKC